MNTRILWLTVAILHFQPRVEAQSQQRFESVLIEAPRPYSKIAADVKAMGGKIKHEYEYVDAVAADVPANAVTALRDLVKPARVVKDLIIPSPATSVVKNAKSGLPTARTQSAKLIKNFSTVPSEAYKLNNLGLNIRDLHTQGLTGSGVVVAVIDSGVQPKYPLLDEDDSVVGGEDFVGDGLGFSNKKNEPHGTFVAGLITGNILFGLGNNSKLAKSVDEHFPGALIAGDLPLVGTAPMAGIYAVRVFSPLEVGAPESRVLAAIEHVINIRKKFDVGKPGGFNIQVANLSLGNTTFYAGRDLFDRSVDNLLRHGIIPVVAAGDTGPSSITVASPATSMSAVAVAAASPAANERVEQDILEVLGFGRLYRPSDATQVAFFSSRGPNADGRLSPGVIATGLANFSQGYDAINEINIASGTSFSAPVVAGMAAVLRQAFPRRSATAIRNAIIKSAGHELFGSGFTFLDYGTGFPDAKRAKTLLASGDVSDSLPTPPQPSKSVAENVEEAAGIEMLSGSIERNTGNLAPGARAEIFYRIPEDTSQVLIKLTRFNATFTEVPNPNAFPEEIYLQVHSAKTSQIGALGDYYDLGNPFVTGGTFAVANPEPGVMRITLSGSYTNAGKVSARVSVSTVTDPQRGFTTRGSISQAQKIVFPVTIPAGAARADFRLSFGDHWGRYPTSDIDMILVDPNLNRNTDGAHLNSPETATMLQPTPGVWQVEIIGFNIPAGSDTFELRVAVDGKVIR